jgi:membrane protein involved in colicin uptake
MSSASHCEIERDLGNPYSVELATGAGRLSMWGTAKKQQHMLTATRSQPTSRSGPQQIHSSSDHIESASDGHSSWFADAHSDIEKQRHEADQKHTQEQAEIAKKHAQVHANIKDKQALLAKAKVLDAQHRHAIDQHAKMEADKQKALEHHEEQVQGAHARSAAASKAAEEAKRAYMVMGTSHTNHEASSNMGHESDNWHHLGTAAAVNRYV